MQRRGLPALSPWQLVGVAAGVVGSKRRSRVSHGAHGIAQQRTRFGRCRVSPCRLAGVPAILDSTRGRAAAHACSMLSDGGRRSPQWRRRSFVIHSVHLPHGPVALCPMLHDELLNQRLHAIGLSISCSKMSSFGSTAHGTQCSNLSL